jgi:heptosyltransferase-1
MSKPTSNKPLRILVVKLTSMGDTLHLLPALSDLRLNYPNSKIDWMIEDSFREIPLWHPSVVRVIPVSTRRWRSLTVRNICEFYQFTKLLRQESYDVIIDAQGLLKSALLARFAKRLATGQRIGFSADSIKEKPAARLYQRKIAVGQALHAIDRLRELFAQSFDYPIPQTPPNYAIQIANLQQSSRDQGHADSQTSASKTPYIVFIPSTTWQSKHLPERLWQELRQHVLDQGYKIKISWGNQREKERAQRLANNKKGVDLLPKLSLSELAVVLEEATGAISVDTGLGHLAAGLGIPTVSLYGATDAKLTGAIGDASVLLQAEYHCSPCRLKQCDKLGENVEHPPCYDTFQVETIWRELNKQIV